MPFIAIRPALKSEIPSLAEIGLAAWCRGIQPLVPSSTAAKIVTANPFLPFLRDMLEQVLVGEVDGEPAGLGACEHGDNLITDIWVAPAFEGLGVGSALIRALEDRIAARGYKEAHISVAAENERARKLYAHIGYRENRRTVQFDPILETSLEKIEMIKQIDK